MTAVELLAHLRRAGVHLWEESGRLRYRGPKGVLTTERVDALRANKLAVLDLLREQHLGAVTPDPGGRFDPFPLTGVPAGHAYLEVNYPDLDPQRARAAWHRLIERHDMLRAVVSPDGYQRVLPEVPPLLVPATDLRDAPSARVAAELRAVRAAMAYRGYATTRWPLFEPRVTRLRDRAVLHLSMNLLVADWASIWLLLGEFEELHGDPRRQLPALEVSFRDYVLAERRLWETEQFARDREYWWARLAGLPGAPELPVVEGKAGADRFHRHVLRLDNETWAGLERNAERRGLTASSVVLAGYAAVLERWSRAPRFSVSLTLLDRLPLHPGVDRVVGGFASTSLLAVDWAGGSFTERAAAISEQLRDDLEHRLCSGVRVSRELAARRGGRPTPLPVGFTSTIGLGRQLAGRLDGAGSAPSPGLLVDCLAMDDAPGLQVSWDVRDGVFPDGVVEDMFEAFSTLVHGLASSDELWESDEPVPLPAWQAEERVRVNDTGGPLPDFLLHNEVFHQAVRTPDRVAVIDSRGRLSYAELAGRAAAVAHALGVIGVVTGDRVAIVMDKGADQVGAVLGTLLAGAVYVPVDTGLPPPRQAAIMHDAGVRQVLTQSWLLAGTEWPPGVEVVAADLLGPLAPARPVLHGDPDDPAYVLYPTAGAGVVISHRAAANTIVDINSRFGITGDDRVLGLAELGADRSVYDVFGPLSVGGALIHPDPARPADPAHLAGLIRGHRVTVWNSTPAQLRMLADHLRSAPEVVLPSLRLALLSGDRLPVTLPKSVRARVPGLTMIGLGGAAEAATWSIQHPAGDDPEPGWTSIPYGTPLTNQGFWVLDSSMRDSPVWTVGELYISGAGLARGYLGDPARTAYRFVEHPADGLRLYRTGTLGRYRPGGLIEFLGHEDAELGITGALSSPVDLSSVLCQLAAPGTRTTPVRIFEVGAGAGVTTAVAVDALGAAEVDYLCTDVSPVLLRDNRSRFGHLPWLRFGLFDVDGDIRGQGLASNSFDVVLTTGALSNARDVEAAVARLVALATPGGWLVLAEPTGLSSLDVEQWLTVLGRAGAEHVLCLPEDEHLGVHLFAGRVKTSPLVR